MRLDFGGKPAKDSNEYIQDPVVTEYFAGQKWFLSECRYVARINDHSVEDRGNGWVIGLARDVANEKTHCLILDANKLQDGPIGKNANLLNPKNFDLHLSLC